MIYHLTLGTVNRLMLLKNTEKLFSKINYCLECMCYVCNKDLSIYLCVSQTKIKHVCTLHGLRSQFRSHPRAGEGTPTKILPSDLIALGTDISGTSSFSGLGGKFLEHLIIYS